MANNHLKTAPTKLSSVDPDDTDGFLSKEHAQEALAQNIEKLSNLQEKLYASQTHGVLVILQGMDTSGKDSLIKHAFSGINPQGCMVHSFKAPSVFELGHTYMWRYVHNLPMRGMIKIFNRSYYEEVTTVRVHPEYLQERGLKESADLWLRRYQEFNQFEEYLGANNISLIKVFLHISQDEQLKRLKNRLENPDKHWKFDISDLRERRLWDEYMKAYEETLLKTHSARAPWHILPANNKWYARLRFSELLVETLGALKLSYPDMSCAIKMAKKQLLS